jgi:hypothetical protein
MESRTMGLAYGFNANPEIRVIGSNSIDLLMLLA